jgi:hypothetical protein
MNRQVQQYKPRLVLLSRSFEEGRPDEDRDCMGCLGEIRPGEPIVVDLYAWYGWHRHEAEEPVERVSHVHCPSDESREGEPLNATVLAADMLLAIATDPS